MNGRHARRYSRIREWRTKPRGAFGYAPTHRRASLDERLQRFFKAMTIATSVRTVAR